MVKHEYDEMSLSHNVFIYLLKAYGVWLMVNFSMKLTNGLGTCTIMTKISPEQAMLCESTMNAIFEVVYHRKNQGHVYGIRQNKVMVLKIKGYGQGKIIGNIILRIITYIQAIEINEKSSYKY